MKALPHSLLSGKEDPRNFRFDGNNTYLNYRAYFTYTYFTYIVSYVAVFIFSLSLIFLSTVSLAATHIITQSGEQFSEPFIKIENNDTIKFVNLDTVNHRLVFSYKGQQDKLTMIKPGESQDVVLDKSGIYDISCANHPDMKMTVYIPYVLKISNRK